MLITILTAGSQGDIQPYVALGVQLQKSGYHVRLATHENYASFVTGFGLEFSPIRGDVSLVASSEQMKSARQADNLLKIMLSFNTLRALIFDLQKDFFEACSGSDAIIYHPGPSIGYFIAQHLNIPSILATPFPMAPTRDYPALILYNAPRLGKLYNLATHKITEQIMWSASGSASKQFWKNKFGHAPENFGSPYCRQITSSLPTIISCSNYVFPKPADWPEHVHNTGYWFLDEEPDWQPPADLMEFLHKGPAPVYVGFGSISNSESAAQTTQVVIDALRQSKQRGVLATGWRGMAKPDSLPDHVFMIDSAPHSWLFPKMAAVVHHGGAGTTAAGLRAGVPGIIIPHSNDQFAWGRRIYELGVGAKPIPKKKLSAENLAQAINFALTKTIKTAAKDLGIKIRSENGTEKAALIIRACLEQSRG